MKTAHQVKETAYSEHTYMVPTSLLEFQKWLAGIIAKIPVKYRSKASIEIESYQEWDCTCTDVVISYWRPETEAEAKERKESDRARTKQQQDRELAELKKLKIKYEGKA